MEYDTFSWKDRCNRYFSSISDTAKDRDQEKDRKPEEELTGSRGSKERLDPSQRETEDYAKWKDLGKMQKKVGGTRFGRYVRKTLTSLSIHGARFAGKSRNSCAMVIWILVIILAIGGVFVMVFYTVRDYRTSKNSFIITSISSSQHSFKASSTPVVTICNLNIIRKDATARTRFACLQKLEDDEQVHITEAMDLYLGDLLAANLKLLNYINGDTELHINDIVKELDSDIEVVEILRGSNLSVDYRLGQAGSWDVVRRRIRPTLTEVKTLGHQLDDMLVDCRVGNRQCRQSELQKDPDTTHGNCFTVVPEEDAEHVAVVLDAESGRYLHSVTSSVGFLVSVHSRDDDMTSGETVMAGTRHHSHITVLEETATQRESPCSQSYRYMQCLDDCMDAHTMELCGCVEQPDDPNIACNYENPPQYICLKAVNLIRRRGKLTCNCLENCRNILYKVRTSSMEWPSEFNTGRMQAFLQERGKQMNYTQIRNNVVKVSVDLKPKTKQIRQQSSDRRELFELLAKIGGLSALVVGLSAVALMELLWTLVRIFVDFVGYFCERSNNVGSRQRLTDSEITSITWAMHRQKRRHEELQKEAEKTANQRRSQPTIGGNVPSRLQRRSSNGSKIYDDLDQFELRNANGDVRNDERSYDKVRSTQLNNNIKADRNGYRKYMHHNNRLRSISEDKRESTRSSEGIRTISEEPHYSVPSIQNNEHVLLSNGHVGPDGDSRYRAQPTLCEYRGPYGPPTSMEGVRLYGSSAAYFYTNTEPTYL